MPKMERILVLVCFGRCPVVLDWFDGFFRSCCINRQISN
jgi:hypothetical protein